MEALSIETKGKVYEKRYEKSNTLFLSSFVYLLDHLSYSCFKCLLCRTIQIFFFQIGIWYPYWSATKFDFAPKHLILKGKMLYNKDDPISALYGRQHQVPSLLLFFFIWSRSKRKIVLWTCLLHPEILVQPPNNFYALLILEI